MMKAIERETVISPEGQLPLTFREAFGRKVRVIILFEEELEDPETGDTSDHLMELAGKISAFRDIEDPVAIQRQWRDEWSRGLE